MPSIPAFTALGAGRTTILMLHGLSGGHLAFAPQVESFAGAGYRAVAWDMPGYGHSAPIEPYTFKGLAQRCIALIESLKCDAVVLLGHGMGGMVAQEVVARRPDRVSRLILCGTSAGFAGAEGEAQRRQVEESRDRLDAGATMAELASELVPRLIGPGSLPEGVRLAEHCMRQVPVATYRRALECLLTFDRRAALGHIGVPTLLLTGEHDRHTPPAAMRAMAAAIPHSTFYEMRGIGHLPNLEAPDDFDGLVLNFLNLPAPLLH